ncbi:KleE protein (plasmid) [Methylophaga frappieri]|uniref:KleE protein n=2 Tax=Gammaproteobacteria TaxID=1236 RepID=I1YLT1_METFJ|nr:MULTISPECIES: KleE stable inheritance protein [Gammaproteobacteria]AFJ03874.1 KleE protein [Methylophaga frappieri]EKF73393.1 KleE protein [Alcanivorax hongdengensis A-11-3]ELJ8710447.1 protein kleE [Vibrio cholerae]HCG9146925.1 protein kleE [Vibrio parahaemolyticus]|tara:strand:- start:46 stop:396 length:351 start_codon:yes stop_codon:yes gene_type:complete
MSKSNIIKFPKAGPTDSGPPDPQPKAQASQQPRKPQSDPTKGGGVLAAILRWVWIAVVLVWPLLKWVISIDVFFQGIRAVYYWNDPAVHAGWTFLAHFAVLTLLTYFVSVYKPKGV